MQAGSAWHNYEETIFKYLKKKFLDLSSHIHTNVSHGCWRLFKFEFYHTRYHLVFARIAPLLRLHLQSLMFKYLYPADTNFKRVFHYSIHIKAYWLYSSVELIPKSRIDPGSGTRRAAQWYRHRYLVAYQVSVHSFHQSVGNLRAIFLFLRYL